MMGDRRGLAKAAAVVALFGLMLFYAYIWPFQVDIDDVRSVAPGPLRDEIDRTIARLPPDQQHNLVLPLPEVSYLSGRMLRDPVVTRGELESVGWIRENAGPDDRFVADIFAAELIMGMTTRVSTEGGDWANAPDVIQMMSDTNEVFKTLNPARASQLAKQMNATLVFVPRRQLNTGWWVPEDEVGYEKFGDARYFREAYRNDNVTIYRVL
jgi:hypothetical protein